MFFLSSMHPFHPKSHNPSFDPDKHSHELLHWFHAAPEKLFWFCVAWEKLFDFLLLMNSYFDFGLSITIVNTVLEWHREGSLMPLKWPSHLKIRYFVLLMNCIICFSFAPILCCSWNGQTEKWQHIMSNVINFVFCAAQKCAQEFCDGSWMETRIKPLLMDQTHYRCCPSQMDFKKSKVVKSLPVSNDQTVGMILWPKEM